MLRRTRIHLALTVALALAGGASCSGDPGSAVRPADRSVLLGLPIGASSSPRLIICPAGDAQGATTLIGPLGGVIAAGNTSVVIPANAVLSPTTFRLSVPASKFVEIEVTAEGSGHFVFELPVTVTIDYARCGRSNLGRGLLTAWNIDPVTKALREPMVSVDNKLARTVTFSTMHFSGYAVAD